MPVMETLAEVDARAMQGVDERSLVEARFINRTARTVIWACRPFNHPVKDFELAELRLPRRDTFGAEIIHEGMLAGSRAYGKKRTQVFIEEIPFLLEAVESAGGFFLDGFFEGEEVFVGELLRHGWFLRRNGLKVAGYKLQVTTKDEREWKVVIWLYCFLVKTSGRCSAMYFSLDELRLSKIIS